jgi:hypothetical protein
VAYVSDRERERAATALRRQYLVGRLSSEQLAERVGRALVARDRRDLRAVFAGLPPVWRDGDEVRRVALAVKRTAVLAALAAAWLAATLVLLVAFGVDVAARGLRLSDAVAFALLWLATTLLVRRARRNA